MEGVISVIVYELASIRAFIHDMTKFRIFERVITGTVYGLSSKAVQIVSIFSDNSVEKPLENAKKLNSGIRRLLLNNVKELVGGVRRLLNNAEVPRALSTRHPAALRSLQSSSVDDEDETPKMKVKDLGPFEPKIETVPVPTALERAGVKPDGAAGGPHMTRMNVFFRIQTGFDHTLAWRCLRELEDVGMQAITLQMGTIMSSLNMSRSYEYAIVNIHVYPAVTRLDTNVTESNKTGLTRSSFATSPLRSKHLFSFAWPYAVIGAFIVIHASWCS